MIRIFSLILPRVFTACALALLVGCDIADIPGLGPDPSVVKRQADAKAIGGACRYGLRSIEDCFNLNSKSSKADMFVGWKEMDQYMRDNKIDGSVAKIPLDQPDPEIKDEKPKEKTVSSHDTSAEKPIAGDRK